MKGRGERSERDAERWMRRSSGCDSSRDVPRFVCVSPQTSLTDLFVLLSRMLSFVAQVLRSSPSSCRELPQEEMRPLQPAAHQEEAQVNAACRPTLHSIPSIRRRHTVLPSIPSHPASIHSSHGNRCCALVHHVFRWSFVSVAIFDHHTAACILLLS